MTRTLRRALASKYNHAAQSSGTGEAIECDTRVPHGFINPGPEPAEFLTVFDPRGEKIHLKARSKRTGQPPPDTPAEPMHSL